MSLTTEQLDSIHNLIGKASKEDLQHVYSMYATACKKRKRIAGAVAKNGKLVGDNVSFNTKAGEAKFGIITKIMKVNIEVKVGETFWRVSPGLLLSA